jgi:hypothetical protein
MWATDDLPFIAELSPPDRLWVIALAIEKGGGPYEYIIALRQLAQRLKELGWWLAEPPGS